MERTMLIIDIESGSVACALARVAESQAPKLFAETRESLPIFSTRDSQSLLREIEKSLRGALLHTSTVAARTREYPHLAQMGIISQAIVFFAPPWSTLLEHKGGLAWEYEKSLVAIMRGLVEEVFGPIPLSLQSHGNALVHATNALFEPQDDFLLCTIMGEVAELILIHDGGLGARVTLPMGHRLLIRTLQTHSGMSLPEAHSALQLASHQPDSFMIEPLRAAGKHFAEQFKDAAREILHSHIPQGILIIAQKPVGQWFAQSLSSDDSLADLFPPNTTVRALHTQHLMPHIAAHAARPDLLLMIETLFADAQAH